MDAYKKDGKVIFEMSLIEAHQLISLIGRITGASDDEMAEVFEDLIGY